MSAELKIGEDAVIASEPESPKYFFKVLNARELSLHKTFTRHLREAGFEIRRVVREPHHANVWKLYLKRGSVMPGVETATVRRTVCAILKSAEVKLPPREIDVLVRSDRVEAFFIFERGVPGILSFYGGRESWLPLEAEPCQGEPG